MILETLGIMAATGLYAWTHSGKMSQSEGKKIPRIVANCGLNITENGEKMTMQLLRKRKFEGGTEYCYRIPLGRSLKDYEAKKHVIEDGLNNRRTLWEFNFEELMSVWRKLRNKEIKINELAKEVNSLRGKYKRKEISLSYDGTLLIRVYNESTRALVEFNEELLAECGGWKICMGEAREGRIWHNFDELPHMIVAGTTRYGKSVFLKMLITTLICTQTEHVRFYLLDLKGGLTMNRFSNLEQVVGVATNVQQSLEMLKEIEVEIKKRETEYVSKGYENITESKTKCRDFIIVDEAAELSPDKTPIEKAEKHECERILSVIARIGGALGFRLIYATQYPTGDILPRQIKQNAVAKICFKLDTEIASRVVLDEGGAENLPLGIKGRGIYKTDHNVIVQTPYIENEFINRAIKPHVIIKTKKVQMDEKQTGGKIRSDIIIIENA